MADVRKGIDKRSRETRLILRDHQYVFEQNQLAIGIIRYLAIQNIRNRYRTCKSILKGWTSDMHGGWKIIEALIQVIKRKKSLKQHDETFLNMYVVPFIVHDESSSWFL